MRAIAQRRSGFTHDVQVRAHTIVSDEPASLGGNDFGPTPQGLIAGKCLVQRTLASPEARVIENRVELLGLSADTR